MQPRVKSYIRRVKHVKHHRFSFMEAEVNNALKKIRDRNIVEIKESYREGDYIVSIYYRQEVKDD